MMGQKRINHEASVWELLLSRLAFLFYGKAVYKEFAHRLPLSGKERVLDFCCGMGTVAYYVAKRLPHGHLTCADISQRWLSVCRKTLRRCDNITFLPCQPQIRVLTSESYDLVYCHFVLHDIPDDELFHVIPMLSDSLKSGGMLAFRDPLGETEKLKLIKRLVAQQGLSLKDSRVTDIPYMGTALESIYIK